MEAIKDWFSQFLNMGISILKILIFSKYFSTSRYKRRKDDRELIIFGNGPSLNTTIAKGRDFINSRDVICVNGFALSELFTEIKPKYYIIADQGFWIKNPLPATGELSKLLFSKIVSVVSWPMNFLIPYDARKSQLISKIRENKNISIIYYNKTSIDGFKWFRNCCYATNLGIPRAENVIIASLILAINLGYKKIYLAGADHSWHETLYVDENNLIYQTHPHFYKDDTKKTPVLDIITGEPVKIYRYFNSLVIVFKSYLNIKEYADSVQSEIINISARSYIDAFRRETV